MLKCNNTFIRIVKICKNRAIVAIIAISLQKIAYCTACEKLKIIAKIVKICKNFTFFQTFRAYRHRRHQSLLKKWTLFFKISTIIKNRAVCCPCINTQGNYFTVCTIACAQKISWYFCNDISWYFASNFQHYMDAKYIQNMCHSLRIKTYVIV